jgi:hypothetical protein
MASIINIEGIGETYRYKLMSYGIKTVAGVDTVVELAQRVPANLYNKMTEVNKMKKLVRRLPSEKQVADWVAQAKRLPRVVNY